MTQLEKENELKQAIIVIEKNIHSDRRDGTNFLIEAMDGLLTTSDFDFLSVILYKLRRKKI